MSRSLNISIADPCHENWDQMTASEQGRFCGSCQKQVVDFSKMSDSQLAAFFKKPTNGSVCGRFFDDQLDRNLEIPRKRIPWVKYFFQFALPAFLMSAKASAQGKPVVTIINTVEKTSTVRMGKIALPAKEIKEAMPVCIKGKVVDENNNPLPLASILLKGTLRGVSADSMGLFRMDKLLLMEEFVLEVSHAGYQTKEITITKDMDFNQDVLIRLSGKVLPEVVISSDRTQVMGGITVKRVVTNTADLLEGLPAIKTPKEIQPMIKVYPNPVVSGTAINIGCEKLEEGYYTYQLVNQSGQQIATNKIWIDKEARLMNVELPTVAAGNYILTLTNKESGKKFTEKIVIQ